MFIRRTQTRSSVSGEPCVGAHCARSSCCPAPTKAPNTAPNEQPVNVPAASPSRKAGEVDRYQEVDLDSLELVDPRSVGVEHAALSAMRQCALQDKLAELGLNRSQIAAAVGNIVARMAQPCSE